MAKYVDIEMVRPRLHGLIGAVLDFLDVDSLDSSDEEAELINIANDLCDAVPAADVRPERHGRWSDKMISQEDEFCKYGDFSFKDFHFGFQCSECGAILNKTPYCGNCGAKMDGEDNE